jgi:hypothetical protein
MGITILAEAAAPVRHPEAVSRFAIFAASYFTPESWMQPFSNKGQIRFQPRYHKSVHPFQALVKHRSPHPAKFKKNKAGASRLIYQAV